MNTWTPHEVYWMYLEVCTSSGVPTMSADNRTTLTDSFGGDVQLLQQHRLVEIKMALRQLAWKYEVNELIV